MPSLTALAPRLVQRARADQIATLFTQWPVATGSMILGAAILITVMWGTVAPRLFAGWMGAIIVNQAWRLWLVRSYRAAAPEPVRRAQWGRAWAVGSTLAGALWGLAGVVLFVPGDPGHQALLIVCLFGVILGGINLTAVYKASLYGFVLPALVPLIVRVAMEGDQLHAFIAAVMLVVLAFILGFGHNLNNVLTQSLAIRYENVDLIAELQAQTAAADHARGTAEAANRGKTQFLAAASHDLRQPLHALGLFVSALASKVREPELESVVGNISASVDALERLFSSMMDISKLDAGAVLPVRYAFPLEPLFQRRLQLSPPPGICACAWLGHASGSTAIHFCSSVSCSTLCRMRFDIPKPAVQCSGCDAAATWWRSRSAIPASASPHYNASTFSTSSIRSTPANAKEDGAWAWVWPSFAALPRCCSTRSRSNPHRDGGRDFPSSCRGRSPMSANRLHLTRRHRAPFSAAR
jgi:hypothetical protein